MFSFCLKRSAHHCRCNPLRRQQCVHISIMRTSVASSKGQKAQLGASNGRRMLGAKLQKIGRPQVGMQIATVVLPDPHHPQQASDFGMVLQAAATELIVSTPELVIPKYCESIHQTRRRPTRTVTVRALSCSREYRAHRCLIVIRYASS